MPSIRQVGTLAVAASQIFSAIGTSRVEDPAIEFKFNRTECLAGYASDSNDLELFGHLSINTSSVNCKGLGVEAKADSDDDRSILSTLNSSRFAEEMDTGLGWTLEAWFTLSNFSECPSCKLRHIASIGTINATETKEECSWTSKVSLLQQNVDHTLAMSEVDAFENCQNSTAVLAFEWGLPVHVVFTHVLEDINSGNENPENLWYVDGVLFSADSQMKRVSWYNNSTNEGFYLQMFSNAAAARFYSDFASPAGSILLFAMYNRALNESEVLQNFDAGLSNSPPVAEDITVIMNEDGATQEEYDNPEIYLRDPMIATVDLPIIVLSVTDMDQELGFPGFNATEASVLPGVFIASLPNLGTLFDFNGTTISDVPHQLSDDGYFSVRYRPEKDEFSGLSSAYTSFTYTAIDGVTGDQSAAAGIVKIYVLPMNDPPIPVNMSATVFAGKAYTLFLAGLEVDSSDGDYIVGAFLYELPAYGALYEVNDSETGLNTEVKSGNSISGQFVIYVYSGNSSEVTDPSSGEFIVQDRFTFRLFDSFAAVSTLGIASLTIISEMAAVTAQSRNDSSWICIEDTESRVNIYAENAVGIGGTVVIVISAIPNYGSLFRVSNNHTLEAGDTLNTSCTADHLCVSSVKYLPAKDYFNSPVETWNGNAVKEDLEAEQFSFYALVENTGEYSNVAVQDIQVSNSNDPTDIQCPAQVEKVEPLGANLYSDSVWSPLDRVSISEISIVDPDESVDVVKVKVSTNFGLVTLNPDYVSSLYFNSHTFCYEEDVLQCLGSGNSERELIFVTDPANAANALNGMVYQSIVSNVTDSIVITIFDGANGKCLSAELLSTGSIQQNCWNVSCTIEVVVASIESSGSFEIADFSARMLVSLGATLVILACCAPSWCFHRICWSKRQRNLA